MHSAQVEGKKGTCNVLKSHSPQYVTGQIEILSQLISTVCVYKVNGALRLNYTTATSLTQIAYSSENSQGLIRIKLSRKT